MWKAINKKPRYWAGLTVNNSLYENGDFNQDGTLNVFDVIMMIDMIIS